MILKTSYSWTVHVLMRGGLAFEITVEPRESRLFRGFFHSGTGKSTNGSYGYCYSLKI